MKFTEAYSRDLRSYWRKTVQQNIWQQFAVPLQCKKVVYG